MTDLVLPPEGPCEKPLCQFTLHTWLCSTGRGTCGARGSACSASALPSDHSLPAGLETSPSVALAGLELRESLSVLG